MTSHQHDPTSSSPRAPVFSAVLLAGGTGLRMDGADKASIEWGGRTLLEWTLDALLDASEVVVLGDWVPTERPVTFTREDPAHGGPVAGLLTGLDALLHTPTWLGVLAVDMPHVTAATFRRLRAAAEGRDGAFLAGAGRRHLAGVLRTEALAATRPDLTAQHGMAVRTLLDPLDLADVAPLGHEARDVDTWADVLALREGRES